MITSTSNPRIKQIAALQTKAKTRRETGLFAAEGVKQVDEIPAESMVQIYLSESWAAQNGRRQRDWERKYGCDRVEIVADAVFRHISDTETPQGALAVARQRRDVLEDLTAGGPVLVLESIRDPGNLGTMIRSAEGAGAAGILADAGTVDRYNPKVVRATMGSLYRVPFVTVSDLGEAVGTLKRQGFLTCAAHLEGSVPFTAPAYPQRTAFLIGNESRGLSAEITAAADAAVRIPMEGRVESLNAAIAATLLLYEWHRQNC